MGAPLHGFNGLIYISGTELTGANAWTLNMPQDAVETPQFGDTDKKRVVGLRDWSGTIGAWLHEDSKLIENAASARASVALMIYPNRGDLTNYYSGNAIFSMDAGGGVSAAIARNASFVGDDTLTITGFS